jgi:hypothetical protein
MNEPDGIICDEVGCLKTARYIPILLLFAPLGDEPAEAQMEMGFCTEHKADVKVEDLVTDEGWTKLCEMFKLNGILPPARERTEVKWLEVSQ